MSDEVHVNESEGILRQFNPSYGLKDLKREHQMNSFIDENRFNILNAIRNTMLSEMQEFRAAMWKVSLATNIVILAFVGWMFTKNLPLTLVHRIVLTLGITTILSTTMFIITSLKKHFADHAIVVNKINKLFGAYETGVFFPDDALFLNKFSWARFGEPGVNEPIFRAAYISANLVYIFSLCAIWCVGYPVAQ